MIIISDIIYFEWQKCHTAIISVKCSNSNWGNRDSWKFVLNLYLKYKRSSSREKNTVANRQEDCILVEKFFFFLTFWGLITSKHLHVNSHIQTSIANLLGHTHTHRHKIDNNLPVIEGEPNKAELKFKRMLYTRAFRMNFEWKILKECSMALHILSLMSNQVVYVFFL